MCARRASSEDLVERLAPWTRQVTGGSCWHTAYVIVDHGVVLEACPHHHRSARTALKCAQKMVQLRELVEIANAGDVYES